MYGFKIGLAVLVLVGIATLALVMRPAVGAAADEKERETLRKFMRAKLASNELILEGLVNKDYDQVKKGAIQMNAFATAEQWRVSKDETYEHYSEDFRRIAKELRREAESEDLEGASLKYVQMTMCCLDCHRWMRSPNK
ncbi:MAG TPA: hypothetical protein VHB77_03925 [Planctomycetaceae bacterium]|nr:hypothetical protein [Planctomycetaceae bacterium]